MHAQHELARFQGQGVQSLSRWPAPFWYFLMVILALSSAPAGSLAPLQVRGKAGPEGQL